MERKIEKLKQDVVTNRDLVRVMLAEKGKGAESTVNKILYENYNELEQKYTDIEEEKEQILLLLFDLSQQFKSIYSHLEISTKSLILSTQTLEYSDPLQLQSPSLLQLIHVQIYNQKNALLLASQISFSLQKKPEHSKPSNKMNQQPKFPSFGKEIGSSLKGERERDREKEEIPFQARQQANKIYKSFYSDEKNFPKTISALEGKLLSKNNLFRELFTLVEFIISSYEQQLLEFGDSERRKAGHAHSPPQRELDGSGGGYKEKEKRKESTRTDRIASELSELKHENEQYLSRIVSLQNELLSSNSKTKHQDSETPTLEPTSAEQYYQAHQSHQGSRNPLQSQFHSLPHQTHWPFNLPQQQQHQQHQQHIPEGMDIDKLISQRERDAFYQTPGNERLEDSEFGNKMRYMNTQMNELQKEIFKRDEKIKIKENSIKILEDDLQLKEAQIHDLNIMVKEFNIRIQQMEERQARRQHTETTLSSQNTKLKALINELTQKSKEQQLILDLKTEEEYNAKNLEYENMNLKSENRTLSQKYEEACKENRELGEKLKIMGKSAGETSQTKEELIQVLNDNLRSCKNSKEAFEKECGKSRKKVFELEAEIGGLKEKNEEMRTVIGKVQELKVLILKKDAGEGSGKIKTLDSIHLDDEGYANTLLVEQIKETLVSYARQIQTLQRAVNVLQGERQSLYQTLYPNVIITMVFFNILIFSIQLILMNWEIKVQEFSHPIVPD